MIALGITKAVNDAHVSDYATPLKKQVVRYAATI